MPPKKELPVKEKSLFKRLIQEVSLARSLSTFRTLAASS